MHSSAMTRGVRRLFCPDSVVRMSQTAEPTLDFLSSPSNAPSLPAPWAGPAASMSARTATAIFAGIQEAYPPSPGFAGGPR